MTELLAEEAAIQERPPLGSARLTGGPVALAVLITIFWGTNPTALKLALRGFPPIGAAGLRFAIAALGVWLWCLAMRVPVRPQRGEMPWLLAVGAFFIVQIATFTLGVYWGTATHSIVILHTYPFFVVALAHFLIPGDRASPGRVIGLVAAFSGIIALFLGELGRWRGTQLLGDVTQLASAFVLAAQIVFIKHTVARIDPNRVVLWQMVLGAPVFLGYSFVFEGLAQARPDLVSTASVMYQGMIIGAFCFTIWTRLIRHHAASRVAIFGFIGPVVGVLLGAFALHEPISPTLIASTILVALGIITANLF